MATQGVANVVVGTDEAGKNNLADVVNIQYIRTYTSVREVEYPIDL